MLTGSVYRTATKVVYVRRIFMVHIASSKMLSARIMKRVNQKKLKFRAVKGTRRTMKKVF